MEKGIVCQGRSTTEYGSVLLICSGAAPQTAESGCTLKDVKTQGNTITWTVICKEATSTGKVTYAALP